MDPEVATCGRTALLIALDQPLILQNILHWLPMRDLLLAQRVSKTFAHLIATTPLLQQDLFFSPQESQKGPESLTNPLLLEYFSIDPGSEQVPLPPRHLGTTMPLVRRICDRHKLFREHASWSRMLVTQPPVKHLEVIPEDSAAGIPSNINDLYDIDVDGLFHTFEENDGLRMGELFDIAANYTLRTLEGFRTWAYFGVSDRDSFAARRMDHLKSRSPGDDEPYYPQLCKPESAKYACLVLQYEGYPGFDFEAYRASLYYKAKFYKDVIESLPKFTMYRGDIDGFRRWVDEMSDPYL